MTLTPTDKAALERAVELYRAGSRTQRKTVDALFARGDSWEDVADYCAFHMQMENLRLPPWQPPPCRIGPNNMASSLNEQDPQRGYRSAALLRQRRATSRAGIPILSASASVSRPSSGRRRSDAEHQPLASSGRAKAS